VSIQKRVADIVVGNGVRVPDGVRDGVAVNVGGRADEVDVAVLEAVAVLVELAVLVTVEVLLDVDVADLVAVDVLLDVDVALLVRVLLDVEVAELPCELLEEGATAELDAFTVPDGDAVGEGVADADIVVAGAFNPRICTPYRT
jgi:hypothetical protein